MDKTDRKTVLTDAILSRLILYILLTICILMTVMPVCAMATEDDSKLIAFTFDDGPSKNTSTLLDGLKSRDVPATFFMCGINGSYGIVNNGQLLNRMVQEGHQLANHSFNHPSMGTLSGSQVSNTFTRVESLLFEYMGGSYTDMVRTPGGVNNATIKESINAPIILWSLDTLDWRNRNEDSVYERIMDQAEDGKIVLMHDLYPTSVQGALRAVDSLKEQGFEFVTVSELFRRRGITLENGKTYLSAPNQGQTLPAYSSPIIETHNDYDALETYVELLTTDEGVSLYYTTDGTYPTLASDQYSEPVKIEEESTFTVVGYDKYGTRTPVVEKTVKKNQVSLPEAKAENGEITLSCETPDSELYYTMDGTEPTNKSKRYTEPFLCKGNTLKIIGVRDQFCDSDVASYAVTDNEKVFYDLDASLWYFPYVNQVVKKGLMDEITDQRFEPQERVTRAMMAQIIYNLEEKPDLNEDSSKNTTEDSKMNVESKSSDRYENIHFSDVQDSDWFADAVQWAAAEGIVNGYNDKVFAPQESITREQMVTILYRYADQYKHQKTVGTTNLLNYPDGDKIEEYAREAFAWAIDNEIISGYSDGTLNPLAFTSRAEAAVILERYIEKYDHRSLLDKIAYFNKDYLRLNMEAFVEKIKDLIK